MRYMITDGLWAAMEPLVNQAKRHKGGQPPVLPDRMFFEAILYIARTGIPLRDLPGEFGAWDAVYNRFRRWVASGALARLFEAMTADPQFGEVRRVLVDSTIVRAHRHAAGAARKSKHLGAAESARRQGLGRSRGGLTSKIVVTAADEDTAIAVDVRPGQAHDAPLLKPMLERTAARLDGVDQVVGDKAFDGAAQRRACAAIGAEAVIPAKANRVDPEPLDRGGLPGAEPGGAAVRQAQGVPPGGDPVREAQADVPGDDPPGPRVHPPPSQDQRQQSLTLKQA